MNEKIKETIRTIEAAFLKHKSKKDILFTVRNEIMFKNIRGIYEYLKKDRRLRIWICFTFPDRFLPGNLMKIRKQISAHSISYRVAEYLKWDLILCPEHTLHFRSDCPKIYVSHGLKSGKLHHGKSLKYGEPSLDRHQQVKYVKIFSANQHEKDIAAKYFSQHHPKIRVVGSLMVDELLKKGNQRQDILKGMNLDTQRKTLLVTSTWDKESLAQSAGLALFQKIKEVLKDYNVIISFHQNNFVRKYSPKINWRKLFAKYDNRNLYILKENEPTLDILPAADILLTDHTSTSLYYLFLGRPIIYYTHPDVAYDKGALILDLRNIAHQITDMDNLSNDIHKCVKKFSADAYRGLADKVCNYAGHAWDRMEEEIYDTLEIKKYSALTNKQSEEVCV